MPIAVYLVLKNMRKDGAKNGQMEILTIDQELEWV